MTNAAYYLTFTYAVERRKPPHQHEIQTTVAAGALHRGLVGRRLHHAEQALVARVVEAGAADRRFGEGVATLAVTDVVDRRLQRLCNAQCAFAVVLQQVEGHALRGLRADSRQRTQRVDEPGERCGVLHLADLSPRREA